MNLSFFPLSNDSYIYIENHIGEYRVYCTFRCRPVNEAAKVIQNISLLEQEVLNGRDKANQPININKVGQMCVCTNSVSKFQ